MDLGINGRRALIFGGSRGIGRAVAGALAVQKVASEATESSGVRAAGYRIDAWDEPSTAALVSRITDDFGAIDLLFGVTRRPALEDRNVLPPGGWQSQLDNGFLRFKAVTETLLPGMQDRGWGRILWMIPWPAAGTSVERQLYAVMSAALSAWVRSIAANLAKDNVTLNLLRPAPVSRTAGSGAPSSRDENLAGSGSIPVDTTLSSATLPQPRPSCSAIPAAEYAARPSGSAVAAPIDRTELRNSAPGRGAIPHSRRTHFSHAKTLTPTLSQRERE